MECNWFRKEVELELVTPYLFLYTSIFTETSPFLALFLRTASKKLGQEVGWFGVRVCPEVAHDMALLLEPLDSFHQLHLAFDNQHINNSHVLDMSVFLEFFSQFSPALSFILRNIVL